MRKSDALILPFFEGQKPAFSARGLTSLFSQPLKAKDFTGKVDEVLCHYPSRGKEKRLILIGLGKEKELTKETLRRSYAKATQWLKGKAQSATIQLPETKRLEKEEIFKAAAEGAFLANYVFDANKSEKEKNLSKMHFLKENVKVLKRTKILCESVYHARDLVIQNADVVTPTFLGKKAQDLARDYKNVKATILDQKQIEKNKMGLLAAVSQGSFTEPVVIVLEYSGAPKTKEVSALVGKGVTYDTGGLNLKPTNFIETMRTDMSGAAAVLGAMRAITHLKLPINVVAIIGSVENAIGPKSYKPGDVYCSYSGVKVEISNTDAEGRLVLADCLSYVQKKYSPTRIIDLATLTGGVVVALGEEVSGLMSNDDHLSEQLIQAGESTFERLCRLPIYPEYKELLKSKIADIKNSGQRKASPIQGGIFLEKFIEKNTPWAHIDIAGTAFPDQLKPYHPVQATGFGVRLLTEFFETLSHGNTTS